MMPLPVSEAMPIPAEISAAMLQTISSSWIFSITTPSDAATCHTGRTTEPETVSSS